MSTPQDAAVSAPHAAPRWPVPAVVLAGLLLLCLGQLSTPDVGAAPRVLFVGVAGAAVLVWLLPRRRSDPRAALGSRLRALAEAHTDALDALPDRRLHWWIALASGAGLFTEMVLIRWHASACHLFAYYKNVSLLAAFLGLGIGYALGRRRPVYTVLVLPAVGAQFVLLYLLRFTGLQQALHNPVLEQPGLGLLHSLQLDRLALSYGFLILAFAFTVLTCLPLGHLASRLMARRPPLVAYSWNLAGSLAGLGLFTLLAYAWSPPAVWLLLTAAFVLPFVLLAPAARVPGASGLGAWPSLAAVGLPLALLAMPLQPDRVSVHSPYQPLALQLERGAPPSLDISHVYHQKILDLSAAAVAQNPGARAAADYYELPFRLKPRAANVLVVGSGTGNDVAAALRRGAGHVDAVEIDPAILAFGRDLHPERPYQDGRVRAILDDARGHIRRTDERYDLVVYGLLDSHTLLSSMTSVRLDSFVYTVEAFREARARLAPDGLLTMTFCLLGEAQGRKFYLMLREAFDGQEPRVFQTHYDNGYMFVIGPGLSGAPPVGTLPAREVTAELRASTAPATPCTDDWPFLYMPVRQYPKSYVVLVSILLLVSLLLTRQLLPATWGEGRRAYSSATCFFLGAGFMLVETRSITELGLTLGNTWQVISAVVAGILVMAFLANWVIRRWGQVSPAAAYGCIALALLLGLLVPPSALAGLPWALGKLAAVGLATLPLFFSGFAFSSELKRHGDTSAALSANLLGAMLGGLLEYNAMYFGFRSLYAFALLLYAAAFAAALLARREPAAQPSPRPQLAAVEA